MSTAIEINELSLMSLEDKKSDRVNLKQVTKRVVVYKSTQIDLARLILKKITRKKKKRAVLVQLRNYHYHQ